MPARVTELGSVEWRELHSDATVGALDLFLFLPHDSWFELSLY